MANKKKEEEVLGTVQPAVQSNYSAEGLNSRQDVENALSVGEINALVEQYALLDGVENPSCEDGREKVEALKKAWSTRPTNG